MSCTMITLRKTRVMALLREIFGIGATKLKLDKRTFTTPSKRIVEISLITSNYHIEMSPGDAGFNDRYVVQEVIKEMASNKNLTSGANKADFKVVILSEVDRLSKQAQAALRRTMERYASTCRLILICNSASKVMDPVRSRCLGIRIGSPTHDEVRCARYFSRRLFFSQCLWCLTILLVTVCRSVLLSKRLRKRNIFLFLMNLPLISLVNPPVIFVERFSCWKPVTSNVGTALLPTCQSKRRIGSCT